MSEADLPLLVFQEEYDDEPFAVLKIRAADHNARFEMAAHSESPPEATAESYCYEPRRLRLLAREIEEMADRLEEDQFEQ